MRAFRTIALAATALVLTGCLEYPARNRPLCRAYDSRPMAMQQGFREQLTAKFRLYDTDGNGRYNRDEFHRKNFEGILALKNKDGDRQLSAAEYSANCEQAGLPSDYVNSCRTQMRRDFSAMSDGRNITLASSRGRILAAWPSNDLNNDGYITLAELYGICD
jgi:hypothetical protein